MGVCGSVCLNIHYVEAGMYSICVFCVQYNNEENLQGAEVGSSGLHVRETGFSNPVKGSCRINLALEHGT